MKPSVLTIAGSDPSGGAGIQADLRVFAALDVVGLSAVTALTVQNSQGVQSCHPVPAELLAAQIESILTDSAVRAVKIGMLGGAAQVRTVAAMLRRFDPPYVVLDPVLASTGGVPLLDEDGIRALLEELLPLCTVVTPNIPEAHTLTGIAPNQDFLDLSLAQRLFELGAKAVLIKGGHASPGSDDALVDTLFVRGEGAVRLAGKRVQTPHTHGTGCLHASAIAACLAKGISLRDAAGYAQTLVSDALAVPVVAGRGRGYPDVAGAVASGRTADNRTHAHRLSLLRGLYVLTDPDLRLDRTPEQIMQEALEGGARIVQLRDKRLSTSELITLARRLNAQARAAGALFIVNDRVDVALASGADGVHLGPGDMHPADARRLLGPNKVVGVSISTVEEALPIAPFASYLGVGAIYGSKTKTDAGAAIGTERIREIKHAFPEHPLVAIGGIDQSNIKAVRQAGADAAAVISAVLCAPDMRQAAECLTRALSTGVSEHIAPLP